MQPKSLYISCAVSNFYGAEIEKWADFGPVGNTEKKIGDDYEQLLRAFFSSFHLNFFDNIVAFKLKSCI